jgi:hypothetical protein
MLGAHHSVRTVTTAGEVFAVLAVERFDVILCDVNLPPQRFLSAGVNAEPLGGQSIRR